MMQKINEAVTYIKEQYNKQPLAGIVLGSGLGNFVKEIQVEKEIAYSSIPNFPVSTVEGHSGKLVFGQLGGKTVVAMAGRFHFYEGYDAHEVVFPIRVMKLLGITTLLISNAAGSTNTNYKVGDLMIINDHISFFQPNPLVGKNITELGSRFPDMSEPYNRHLIAKAKTIAAAEDIKLREGVYCGVTGPTFETRAEYQLILTLGGDAVGMSTVQEVIVAAHLGLPVFAISVITDIGLRNDGIITTHEEVLQAAKEAEPKLAHIFTALVAEL